MADRLARSEVNSGILDRADRLLRGRAVGEKTGLLRSERPIFLVYFILIIFIRPRFRMVIFPLQCKEFDCGSRERAAGGLTCPIRASLEKRSGIYSDSANLPV
jgi:hypothetical protein